jgi:hypothetical protein
MLLVLDEQTGAWTVMPAPACKQVINKASYHTHLLTCYTAMSTATVTVHELPIRANKVKKVEGCSNEGEAGLSNKTNGQEERTRRKDKKKEVGLRRSFHGKP